jgi:hypothetical protein
MKTMSKRIIKFSTLSLFLTTILIGSIISTISAQMPFIDIEEDKDTWIPTGIYDGYYYYVNPPGTEFSNVEYWGYTGSGRYTTAGTDTFSYSTPQLYRGGNADEGLLKNTSRSSLHNLFDDEPYPTAVRINAGLSPVFEQSQKKAINLHMDYSTTFLAEEDVEYLGFINSSEPFLLDVYFHDQDAYGDLDFPSAFPYSYSISYKKMTYPIFPREDNPTSLLNFTLIINYFSSSLVTLTPHPWEFPDWIPTIGVNTTFIGEFEQGANDIVDKKTGEMVDPEYDFFSIRMFNISLVQDEYYKIYTDYNMRDGSSPTTFLVGDHYEYLSGDMNGDGFYIYAEESENATLVLFSPGLARGDYIILFQNISPVTEEYETEALTLNTNITMEYLIYYTFTFDEPHMMAINSTNYFDLEFYIQGAAPKKWIRILDWWSFWYANWVATDDLTWMYIPEGTYAFEVIQFWFNEEIRFNAVPVQQPKTVSVDQDSIIAIELPLVKNRINLVNLSTSDHVIPPQRVWYEWTYVNKHNELFHNTISTLSSPLALGNQNSTGQWLEFDSNNTNIYTHLPTHDFETPILMIRPFDANNWTHQTTSLPAFIATLTVSVNVAVNQSYTPIDLNYIGGNRPGPDGATFIPLSSISATSGFSVNIDYTTDDDQIYGIPLTLDPFNIYNITVYLLGNYSTYTLGDLPSDFLNATLQGTQFYVHGGNLRNLEIFNSHTSDRFDNTSMWRSLLILTVSDTSYLYVDLEREGPYNATMQIVITKLSLTNMDFDLPDHEYNDTTSNLEVLTEDLLATQIMSPEMEKPRRAPGFELVLAIGTLVVLSTGISLKRRKK